jgi:PhnB protein
MALTKPNPSDYTNDDVPEIRRLLTAQAAALHDKDVEAVMANVSEDILCFNMAPPLGTRGAAVYRRNLEMWFSTWDGPIDHYHSDLEISVGGDVAFATAYQRIGGAKKGGGAHGLWGRLTVGLRKIEGRWTVVHEHVSTPFYMDGSLRAAVDLIPDR